MAEDVKDPRKLPKASSSTDDLDFDAKGGSSTSNLDLPSTVRGFGRLEVLLKAKKAKTSQTPSEN